MKKKGMLVIISGPSGSGKGTVVKQLNPKYSLSISMTTRAKRPHEADGKDYFFISEEEFIEKRDGGKLLEHAVFCGNYYGTPKEYVESQIAMGKAVILEIEVEGALQVKEKFNDCVLVFLMPPTISELIRRLNMRNTEDSLTIEQRIIRAKKEITYIEKYDYLVINDFVEDAAKKIETIIEAEYLKPHRHICDVEHFKGDE